MATPKKIEIGASPEGSLALTSKQMDLEAGWLGKWFGTGKNASINIAGLLVLILVVSGIAIIFSNVTGISPVEFWKLIIPIITLALGFMFGRGSN